MFISFRYFAGFMISIVLGFVILINEAQAQDARQKFPQIDLVTPSGIDLQTATFAWSGVDLVIGPLVVDHHVKHTDITPLPNLNVTPKPFLTSLNNRIYSGDGTSINVILGSSTIRFNLQSSGNIIALDSSAPGWKLSYNGTNANTATNATLSYKNGDIYQFNGGNWRSALLTFKQSADGSKIEYFYDASNRVNFVRSNRGYAISINWTSSKATACGINLAVTNASQGFNCVGSTNFVEYDFNASEFLTSLKDVKGNVRTISYTNGFVSCITFQPSTACEIQNQTSVTVQGERYVSQQTTADAKNWTYSYSSGTESPSDYVPSFGEIRYSSIGVTDPDGRATIARFGNGFLASYTTGATDPAVRQSISYEYSLVNAFAVGYATGWSGPHYSTIFPSKVKYAEGNSVAFTRDDADNVTARQEMPKPGASEPIANYSWTYPQTNVWSNPTICAVANVLCDKPTKFKDASNAETDYTYDATHGGMLTKTLPAAANGVRPQMRYSYAQRNAMIKNAAGAFVAMQPPIWVLTQESICKTGASTATGCATASDEVRTVYEYGPTTGANNLLLRGVVNDSIGVNARTCYQYDALGRKIAETAPLGTGSTCP